MKTVFLHGIHTQNVGDDLFFKIILERYSDARFLMRAPEEYRHIYSKYNNLRVVSDTDNIVKIASFFNKLLGLPINAVIYIYILLRYPVSLFLIVGGSLFIEGDSNLPSLLLNLKKIRYLKPNMKVAIIGSNFGPCVTNKWKSEVEKGLNCVDDICFRDMPSYNVFSDLSNVRYGNDIVLHMKANNKVAKTKTISVNIRSVEKWPTLKPLKEDYLFVTKKLIEVFQSKGYTVNLLSFCKQYGDNEITEELFESLSDKQHIKKIYYEGNLEEVLQTISSSEYMIATRFHAIILSLLYGVKVLPVSYSIKTESMLKTLNLWSDIYDYDNYSKADCKTLLDSFIMEYIIDDSFNTQFDYVDRLLKIN